MDEVGVNVLIVDDSDVIRSMILKTLRLADVPIGTAYEAGNGKEALEIIDSNWVDLVLADINMPIMDGVEMLRRLRADDKHLQLPVIVVTTEGSSERIVELEAAGVSAYVRKPFTPEQIRDVVGEVTSGLSAGETATSALQSAFAEVLERFVLMDGAPGGAELPEPAEEDGDLFQASMTFRGAVTGAMTLAAPYGLCLEMAANAIGVDPTDSTAGAKAGDALGEVLNMTCGCLVMELEPDRPTDLTPPVVLGMEESEWDYLAQSSATVGFIVEGRPALVSCVLRPRR